MSENLADEIRKTIESVKDMKIQVSGINNYLSILEWMMRADIQKKVDEAYQRGYDKGYADKINNDEVGKELAKDIYQKGLDDAWEVVKTLFKTFGAESACVIMKNDNVHGAIDRLKAYEEQKADDEIKVGDEVTPKRTGGWKGVVIGIDNDDAMVMTSDGYSAMYRIEILCKTGRHFDIESILKEMSE